MPKIAIIGAGISGLTTAYVLKKNGFTVDIFDKSPIPGGVIQTLHENGFLCELGPSTLMINDLRILNLLKELGLENTIIDNNPKSQERYIVKNAIPTPVPRSLLSFIKTPLFSLKAKLRLLKEPFIKKQENPNETVAHFVKRRLGPEFLDYAVEPFVSGVYAGDPEQLSIRHAFPKLYNLENTAGSLFKGAFKKKKNPYQIKSRTISFKQGMATLPLKLAEILKESLHLESTILSITQKDHNWELSYQCKGIQKTESYSDIILTVPAYQLNDLPLPPSILQSLAPLKKITYAPIAVVTHAFNPQSIPNAPRGFGLLIPSKEGFKTLGTLFTSSMFPDQTPKGYITLRTFVGGTRNPNIYNESPETIENKVWNDLTTLFDIKDFPVYSHVHIWEKAIPQYNLEYQQFLDAIDNTEKRFPGIHFIGNYRTGISLPQCILAGLNVLSQIQINNHA